MGLLDEAGGDFYRFNCFDLEAPGQARLRQKGHLLRVPGLKASKVLDFTNLFWGNTFVGVEFEKWAVFPIHSGSKLGEFVGKTVHESE